MEEGWKDDQKEKEWACRRLQQVEQATADHVSWVKKSVTAVYDYKNRWQQTSMGIRLDETESAYLHANEHDRKEIVPIDW